MQAAADLGQFSAAAEFGLAGTSQAPSSPEPPSAASSSRSSSGSGFLHSPVAPLAVSVGAMFGLIFYATEPWKVSGKASAGGVTAAVEGDVT